MEELNDELGISGNVVMIEVKTRSDWINQAEQAILDAEMYGATTPNEMKQREKDLLREALKALGQNPLF